MRVPLKHDDDGAVAVIVAIMSTVLFLFGAFAVDVGNAYAQKRELSVAADAAATAAVMKLGMSLPAGFSCVSGNLTSVMRTTAQTEAARIIALNDRYGATTVPPVTVSCADTSTLQVRVDDSRDVRTVLGVLAGKSLMRPNASATARFVRGAAGLLRPWAVCDDTAVAAAAFPGRTFATGLDTQIGVCGTTASGQWGGVDFDGGANSAGDLAAWTSSGYTSPVTVPGTLFADPGVSGSSQLSTAFQAMAGSTVLFPTVSGYVAASGGNPAQFDSVHILKAKVCGVQYGGKTFTDSATASPCWVDPVNGVTWDGTVAMTAGSGSVSASKGLFTKYDIGRTVKVVGAGTPTRAGKPTDLMTTVKSVTTGRTAVLTDPAASTVTASTITLYPVPMVSGRPIDHIQFEWVATLTASSDLANSSCGLADTMCSPTVVLWK